MPIVCTTGGYEIILANRMGDTQYMYNIQKRVRKEYITAKSSHTPFLTPVYRLLSLLVKYHESQDAPCAITWERSCYYLRLQVDFLLSVRGGIGSRPRPESAPN